MEIVRKMLTPKGYILLWIIGCVYAAFCNIVFQDLMGAGTLWGRNSGWQTEVAFWDITMVYVLLCVLKNNKGVARHIIIGLIILSTFLGINHLLAAIKSPISWGNWGGFIMNLFGWVLGIVILYMQFKKSKVDVKGPGVGKAGAFF